MKRYTLLLCAVLSGCEQSGYQLAEVAGRVTHRGQPMAGVSITFQPTVENGAINPGPSSVAMIDEAGRYRLQTAERVRQLGAVVGRNRVFLRAIAPINNDEGGYLRDPRIPPRFRDGSTVIEVPPQGLTSADFELAPP